MTFEGWRDTTEEHHAALSLNQNMAHSRFGGDLPDREKTGDMFYQGMAFNEDPAKQVYFRAADGSFVSPKYYTIGSKAKKEVSDLRKEILMKGSESPFCPFKGEVQDHEDGVARPERKRTA